MRMTTISAEDKALRTGIAYLSKGERYQTLLPRVKILSHSLKQTKI